MRQQLLFIEVLILISVVACHRDPRAFDPESPASPSQESASPKANGPEGPAAMNDESAVGNGGGVLVSILHDTISHELMDTLEESANRGILTEQERKTLKAYLARHEVLIQPVDPVIAATRHTTDVRGDQSLTRDGKMLEFGKPVNERLVFDHQLHRWVIQMDEIFWSDALALGMDSDESVPRELYPQLLSVVLQYHHALGVIERSGVGADSLAVKEKPVTPEKPKSFRKALEVKGAVFLGDVSCLSVSILYDVVSPETRLAAEKCRVRTMFHADGKVEITAFALSGKEANVPLTNEYTYSQDHVWVKWREGVLVRTLQLSGWGNDDVLELSPKDHLYRVSSDAPSLTGKTFTESLFCEVAEKGGLFRSAKWEPRAVLPLTSKKKCRVTLTLKEGGSFELMYEELGGATRRYIGHYEQIGFNLVLNHNTGEVGYLWICRECKDHLVMGGGEMLFSPDSGAHAEEPDEPWGVYDHSKDPIPCGKIFYPHTADPALCELTVMLSPLDKAEREKAGFDGVVQVGVKRRTSGSQAGTKWYSGTYSWAGSTVHLDMINFKQGLTFKNTGIGLASPDFHLLAQGETDDAP